MAAAVASGGWHTGERAIQQTLLGDRERPRDNPTYHGLAPSYGYRVQNSPLSHSGPSIARAGPGPPSGAARPGSAAQ
ncbi:hypothetical protein PG987_000952 [Apiospora arundinis]